MNNKYLQVSIIIPTHNQKGCLRDALLSLNQLEYSSDKYEVIVVDDGSTDGTDQMIREMQRSLTCPLQYIRQKKLGSSSARNRAMEIARGEIYIFTDSDCTFEKDWINKLVRHFDSPNIGVVGGPDKAPPTDSIFSRCVDYLFTSFIGTGGLRRGRGLRIGKYYPKCCNMAIPKRVIKEVGGFDERLEPGQEIELDYRTEKAGYQIGYAPDALVWHKRKNSVKSLLLKMFRIGYNRVVIGCMHKELFQIGHLIPVICLLTMFSLVVLSFVSLTVFKVLISILSIYVFILFISSIDAALKIKDIRALLITIFLIPLHHLAHSMGFLVGVISHLFNPKRKLKRSE